MAEKEIKTSDTPAVEGNVSAKDKNPGTNISTINDLASREDHLGFTPYVEAIADFLANKDTHPPLTLSIEGDWGSGKSSFMLQLQAALRKRKRNLVVWFNPWRHDKDESVWSAFALQFIHDVKRQQWFWRRWLGNIQLLVRRFSWESGWVDLLRKFFLWVVVLGITAIIGIEAYRNQGTWTNQLGELAQGVLKIEGRQDIFAKGIGAGGWTAYIALLLMIFSKLESIVGDPLKIDLKNYVNAPDYGARVSFIERFHRDFGHIVEAYAGRQTVYVFIDDVDRCEVPKAADLMSALNLMIANDARIIFIIGMDPEKVAAGLAVKHEKLLPYLSYNFKPGEDNRQAGLDYGFNFIKKFVQLRFLLPRPDGAAIEEFLKRMSEPIPAKNWRQDVLGKIRAIREREYVEVPYGADEPYIHEIAKMIAPAFQNNPRHIKQFINLLRLQTYIADKTGLFQKKRDVHALSREQFGKFIAIKLQWDLLIDELDSNPRLLSFLQKLALDPDDTKVTPSAALERWRRRADLMEFLNLGCRDDQGSRNTETEKLWSLENVDTSELLRVSSQVRKAPSADDSLIAKEAKREETLERQVSAATASPNHLSPRVLMLTYNPIISSSGERLIAARGWNDPAKLAEDFRKDLYEASHGLVDAQIINQITVDGWPVLTDGFTYDQENYFNITSGKSAPRSPAQIDYQKLLKEYDIPRQIAEDKIDEVWIFGFPYAGLYESIMAGSGAFWCNAPPLKVNAPRRFVVMGFSCDRGVGEMLEAYGHRAESILEKTFDSPRAKTNFWRQFLQYDKVNPGQANMGTMHFAPNSDRDYDWGNTRKVSSNCYDWFNFPDFKGDIREVDASEWGNGDIRAHHLWWFRHLPHTGGDMNGISNNWWEYIVNPNNVILYK